MWSWLWSTYSPDLAPHIFPKSVYQRVLRAATGSWTYTLSDGAYEYIDGYLKLHILAPVHAFMWDHARASRHPDKRFSWWQSLTYSKTDKEYATYNFASTDGAVALRYVLREYPFILRGALAASAAGPRVVRVKEVYATVGPQTPAALVHTLAATLEFLMRYILTAAYSAAQRNSPLARTYEIKRTDVYAGITFDRELKSMQHASKGAWRPGLPRAVYDELGGRGLTDVAFEELNALVVRFILTPLNTFVSEGYSGEAAVQKLTLGAPVLYQGTQKAIQNPRGSLFAPQILQSTWMPGSVSASWYKSADARLVCRAVAYLIGVTLQSFGRNGLSELDRNLMRKALDRNLELKFLYQYRNFPNTVDRGTPVTVPLSQKAPVPQKSATVPQKSALKKSAKKSTKATRARR